MDIFFTILKYFTQTCICASMNGLDKYITPTNRFPAYPGTPCLHLLGREDSCYTYRCCALSLNTLVKWFLSRSLNCGKFTKQVLEWKDRKTTDSEPVNR